uniref:Serpentine receptor class gamma n=1 Tax=Meloidogyne hapla TaxID=6305 RepID=A0A1I8B353_MELHA
MTIDTNVQEDYYRAFQAFFSILCAIFLLILIRPLYKFSKERTALFILFSKSCANILYQFREIYVSFYKYFSFSKSFWSWFFLAPCATVLLNAGYFHIIGLAINRFHAVFFAISYQSCWKLK